MKGPNATPHDTICSAKLHFPTAGAAWEALRRMRARVHRHGTNQSRILAKGDTPLEVYRCRCSRWALGHSAPHISR